MGFSYSTISAYSGILFTPGLSTIGSINNTFRWKKVGNMSWDFTWLSSPSFYMKTNSIFCAQDSHCDAAAPSNATSYHYFIQRPALQQIIRHLNMDSNTAYNAEEFISI